MDDSGLRIPFRVEGLEADALCQRVHAVTSATELFVGSEGTRFGSIVRSCIAAHLPGIGYGGGLSGYMERKVGAWMERDGVMWDVDYHIDEDTRLLVDLLDTRDLLGFAGILYAGFVATRLRDFHAHDVFLLGERGDVIEILSNVQPQLQGLLATSNVAGVFETGTAAVGVPLTAFSFEEYVRQWLPYIVGGGFGCWLGVYNHGHLVTERNFYEVIVASVIRWPESVISRFIWARLIFANAWHRLSRPEAPLAFPVTFFGHEYDADGSAEQPAFVRDLFARQMAAQTAMAQVLVRDYPQSRVLWVYLYGVQTVDSVTMHDGRVVRVDVAAADYIDVAFARVYGKSGLTPLAHQYGDHVIETGNPLLRDAELPSRLAVVQVGERAKDKIGALLGALHRLGLEYVGPSIDGNPRHRPHHGDVLEDLLSGANIEALM